MGNYIRLPSGMILMGYSNNHTVLCALIIYNLMINERESAMCNVKKKTKW